MTGPNPPYKKILPGMYLDADDSVVFNAADILEAFGLPDTPENRMEVLSLTFDFVEKANQRQPFPMKLTYRLPGDPEWRPG